MYLCLKLFAVFYIFCSFLQLRKKRRKTENMEDKSYSLLIISNFYCFPRHPMTFSSNLFIRVHCFTAVSQIRFFLLFSSLKISPYQPKFTIFFPAPHPSLSTRHPFNRQQLLISPSNKFQCIFLTVF